MYESLILIRPGGSAAYDPLSGGAFEVEFEVLKCRYIINNPSDQDSEISIELKLIRQLQEPLPLKNSILGFLVKNFKRINLGVFKSIEG